MRAVDSAIWTSGDPVSPSARLCSAISLPLTSFCTAKLTREYTRGQLPDVFDAPVRARVGPAAPLPRTVDHDRVGVAERVVPGRHQLDPGVGARHLAGAWVVRFHGERRPIDQDR